VLLAHIISFHAEFYHLGITKLLLTMILWLHLLGDSLEKGNHILGFIVHMCNGSVLAQVESECVLITGEGRRYSVRERENRRNWSQNTGHYGCAKLWGRSKGYKIRG
jgi:hypothetical protein